MFCMLCLGELKLDDSKTCSSSSVLLTEDESTPLNGSDNGKTGLDLGITGLVNGLKAVCDELESSPIRGNSG